ncbi:MAG: RNA methyltransferase [Alphaproteobacteria bacterium]|nr:RNA methyltransferase [Alphaproteobacteria bacterium]MBU1525870.1 RNA methyltransferase [Alphaproteobacteria bacterium]MBU2117217.1 RNA methyltransferase [Alphaproteobacteria bacterium]MBU2350455.1 RNA methyltransferase [Alphaproteobacteria bacterium]MBU2381069.1 RNA methyltransferase [Alphaproteobacteria bacterium]
MSPIVIEDLEDPRVAGFRDVRERDLIGRRGLFVAEGAVVLRALVAPTSRCAVESVLLDERRAGGLADVRAVLGDRAPVYVAAQGLLDAIAGFPLHRGILALGRVPAPVPLADAVGPGPKTLLVVGGVGNHDNMGALMRNAAAFGVDAVVLDDRCCDPFYRKALRVAVGATLALPIVRGGPLEAVLAELQTRDVECLALSPAGGERLRGLETPARRALVVGTEGPGLPPGVIASLRSVRIDMRDGFDSLNVATAAAVALHEITQP